MKRGRMKSEMRECESEEKERTVFNSMLEEDSIEHTIFGLVSEQVNQSATFAPQQR